MTRIQRTLFDIFVKQILHLHHRVKNALLKIRSHKYFTSGNFPREVIRQESNDPAWILWLPLGARINPSPQIVSDVETDEATHTKMV